MNYVVFEEGRAAAKVGLPKDFNPYRKHIRNLANRNIEAASLHYNNASDWMSGWFYGERERARDVEDFDVHYYDETFGRSHGG